MTCQYPILQAGKTGLVPRGIFRGALALLAFLTFAIPLLALVGCSRSESSGNQAVAPTTAPALVQASAPPATSPAASATSSDLHRYVAASGSQAVVTGTSTLHDWTVKAAKLDGNAVFAGKWEGQGAAAIRLESISLAIPVASLKSTEGSSMDNNMYAALKKDQQPLITYTLTKATLKTPAAAGGEYRFDTVGDLTVAGTAHSVNLELVVTPHGKGLTIVANTPLKMTDFGVKPPTAMFGTIKSGDAINVKATWQLDEQ